MKVWRFIGDWRCIIRHPYTLAPKDDLETGRDARTALLAAAGACAFGNSKLYMQNQTYVVKLNYFILGRILAGIMRTITAPTGCVSLLSQTLHQLSHRPHPHYPQRNMRDIRA